MYGRFNATAKARHSIGGFRAQSVREAIMGIHALEVCFRKANCTTGINFWALVLPTVNICSINWLLGSFESATCLEQKKHSFEHREKNHTLIYHTQQIHTQRRQSLSEVPLNRGSSCMQLLGWGSWRWAWDCEGVQVRITAWCEK